MKSQHNDNSHKKMTTDGSETNSPPVETISSLNEFILKEVELLYEPADVSLVSRRKQKSGSLGLHSIATELSQQVGSVQRKVTILILGNTNAGKSTFVNWFVHDGIVSTGISCETNKFAIITSGKQPNELSPDCTLALFPMLRAIVNREPDLNGMFISKMCPNLKGKLSLVNLIDSPGCTDSTETEQAAMHLAEQADLIFIFLDPMTPSIGKNLLSLIGQIYGKASDRIRLCLTKIDEITSEEERTKLLCQITQSLAGKIISKRQFDLIPIFIPGAKDGTYLTPSTNIATSAADCLQRLKAAEASLKSKTVNRIGELLVEIDSVVERKVQASLNSLRTDVEKLIFCVEDVLEADDVVKAFNRTRYTSSVLIILAIVVLVAFGCSIGFAFLTLFHGDLVRPILANSRFGEIPLIYATTLVTPLQYHKNVFSTLGIVVSTSIFLLLVMLSRQRSRSVIPRSKRIVLQDQLMFLYKAHERWTELNRSYLDSCT